MEHGLFVFRLLGQRWTIGPCDVAWEFAWLTPDRVIVIGPESSARDVVKTWRSPLGFVGSEGPRWFGFEVDYVAYVLEISTRRGVALFHDRARHRDPIARLELRDRRARVVCAAILDPQISSAASANGCAALILTMEE
jgi:hypothetical protein